MRQKIVRITQWTYLIDIALIVILGLVLQNRVNENIQSAIEILIVLGIALLWLSRKKIPVARVLPYTIKPTLKTALITVVLGIATGPIVSHIEQLSRMIFKSDVLTKISNGTGLFEGPILLQLLFIAVIPAVGEELMCRGLIFGGFRQTGKKWVAIIVSAIMFSLMHGNFQQIPYTFLMGLLLGYELEVTGTLWIPMIHHFVNNGLAVFAGRFPKLAIIYEVDYANHPIRTAIILVVGLVLMYICLKSLAPSEQAIENKNVIEKAIEADKNSEEKKVKFVTFPLVLAIIYWILNFAILESPLLDMYLNQL